MKCINCKNGIESNRSFYPIEPPKKDRMWACEICIDEVRKLKTANHCLDGRFCTICKEYANCLGRIKR